MESPDQLTVELYRPDGNWAIVGWLRRHGERNWFETADLYWETADRPVLGQVFEEHGPGWLPTTRTRLPNWFGHLLPEGRLRRAVADEAKVHIEREFHLLSLIGGADLPGGIRIHAGTHPDSTVGGLAHDALEVDAQPASLDPRLKFSLAGVQLKFSSQALAKGFAIPGRGETGSWILKLPGVHGFNRVTRLECATLTLARAVGIEVPDHALVPIGDVEGLPAWAAISEGEVLAVDRFDRRPGGGRVHFEELAQVLDIPTAVEDARYDRGNFETVVRVIASLCGDDDAIETVRRIVFLVLVGNGDAHLKNWAITYPDGVHPRLSPAYDLVPTRLLLPNDGLGLKLNGSRAFADVRITSFEALATRVGLDPARVVRVVNETIDAVAEHWGVLEGLLDEGEFDRITKQRDSLAITNGRAS